MPFVLRRIFYSTSPAACDLYSFLPGAERETCLIYVIHHSDRFLALVFLSNLFYHHVVMLLKVGAILEWCVHGASRLRKGSKGYIHLQQSINNQINVVERMYKDITALEIPVNSNEFIE